MIVRPNKGFETNSLCKNKDWYEAGNYVVDETTPEGAALASRIKAAYPYFDLVVVNGALVDIKETARPVIDPAVEVTPAKDPLIETVAALTARVSTLEKIIDDFMAVTPSESEVL